MRRKRHLANRRGERYKSPKRRRLVSRRHCRSTSAYVGRGNPCRRVFQNIIVRIIMRLISTAPTACRRRGRVWMRRHVAMKRKLRRRALANNLHRALSISAHNQTPYWQRRSHSLGRNRTLKAHSPPVIHIAARSMSAAVWRRVPYINRRQQLTRNRTLCDDRAKVTTAFSRCPCVRVSRSRAKR